jgi:hypothetical protein
VRTRINEQRLGLRQRDDLESDGYDGSNRASAGRHNPGIDDELHLPCFVIEGRLDVVYKPLQLDGGCDYGVVVLPYGSQRGRSDCSAKLSGRQRRVEKRLEATALGRPGCGRRTSLKIHLHRPVNNRHTARAFRSRCIVFQLLKIHWKHQRCHLHVPPVTNPPDPQAFYTRLTGGCPD